MSNRHVTFDTRLEFVIVCYSRHESADSKSDYCQHGLCAYEHEVLCLHSPFAMYI